MNQFSDEQLVREYYGGEKGAFTELFNRYKLPLFNFARRILGNRADAEDALSEVFMAIATQKYTIEAGAKFSTWAYTVTRNACLTSLRKQRHTLSLWRKRDQDQGEEEQWQLPDEGPSVSDQAISKEKIKAIQKALELMPVNLREALVLREYQDLSYKDIAQVLGCSLDNVKVLIFRGREFLSNHLRKSDPELFGKEGSL
ncbi:MAG TPA: RNA polymerase sigma factor [Candidatus Omnitrophota bacterium]|jgi:RNA polymerase sigma-70 factor (ECF subfamily)|nr:RNA polymerase sigma factor [Candidatus Omnitrophota bacterium]